MNAETPEADTRHSDSTRRQHRTSQGHSMNRKYIYRHLRYRTFARFPILEGLLRLVHLTGIN